MHIELALGLSLALWPSSPVSRSSLGRKWYQLCVKPRGAGRAELCLQRILCEACPAHQEGLSNTLKAEDSTSARSGHRCKQAGHRNIVHGFLLLDVLGRWPNLCSWACDSLFICEVAVMAFLSFLAF